MNQGQKLQAPTSKLQRSTKHQTYAHASAGVPKVWLPTASRRQPNVGLASRQNCLRYDLAGCSSLRVQRAKFSFGETFPHSLRRLRERGEPRRRAAHALMREETCWKNFARQTAPLALKCTYRHCPISMPVGDIFYAILLTPEKWAHWRWLIGGSSQIRPGNKIIGSTVRGFPTGGIGK